MLWIGIVRLVFDFGLDLGDEAASAQTVARPGRSVLSCHGSHPSYAIDFHIAPRLHSVCVSAWAQRSSRVRTHSVGHGPSRARTPVKGGTGSPLKGPSSAQHAGRYP